MAADYHLLIVDPDTETKSSISDVLENEFAIEHIFTASSGTEALDLLSSNQNIDCIIASTQLNDNSGFSLISDIKQHENHQQTSILLMTEQKDPDYLLKAAACGASDLILKPFATRDLTLKLRNLITNKENNNPPHVAVESNLKILIYCEHEQFADAELVSMDRNNCTLRVEQDTFPSTCIYQQATLNLLNGNNVLASADATISSISQDPQFTNVALRKILVTFQYKNIKTSNTIAFEKILHAFKHEL